MRDAHWRHRRLRDDYAGRPMPVLPWWMSAPDEPLNPTERAIFDHISATSRLLDVGAGDRRIQKKLVAAGYRGRYETVDLSPEYSPDHLDLAEVPAAAYDAVMALEVVEHLPLSEFDGFVDGLLRALAPGGRLVVSTPNAAFYAPVYFQDLGHVHAYEAPGLAAYLELRGVPCQVFRVDWRARRESPRERARRHAVRFITRGLLQVDYARGVLLLGQRAGADAG